MVHTVASVVPMFKKLAELRPEVAAIHQVAVDPPKHTRATGALKLARTANLGKQASFAAETCTETAMLTSSSVYPVVGIASELPHVPLLKLDDAMAAWPPMTASSRST